MLGLLKDFFTFAAQPQHPTNRRKALLQFLCKDYPAYLWQKPSLRRVIVFPFLVVAIVIYGYRM